MRETIDGAVFTDMLLCASASLSQSKQEINDLNVFPVPDGDTGTNMSMTMEAGAEELRRKAPRDIGEASKIAATALLRGARGNSGVILSLLFRGVSKSLKGKKTAGPYELAKAMSEGVDSAYKAVMKPAEGTILTVSRLAAASANDFAETGADVELMLSCALEAAKDALAETVNQNPVLKKAGVIDAGGMGYVLILEAALGYLQGKVTPDSYKIGQAEAGEHADFGHFDSGDIAFAFDTVFIIRRAGNLRPIETLRNYLASIGDSIVIGEDDEQFKVHVHTNTPGEALSEAQKYGILEIAKIENMRTQHDELLAAKEAEESEPEEIKEFGTVVVCAGKGIEDLFLELGADKIVTGGQTMNPATEDILNAIAKTPAETVFVFPNNKNIIMAAEQCIPLSEKKVIVIPTKTISQGISALLSLDTHSQSEEEIIETAQSTIEEVHTSLITYASRDSEFDGRSITAGEYLSLLDGALLGSDSDLELLIEALGEISKELDPEFITVYYGEDADEVSAEKVGEILQESNPEAEISIINGGQPVYYYMISIE